MDELLREALAEYAHNAWSNWMEYLFKHGEFAPVRNVDGSVYYQWRMSDESMQRWQRQMKTAYQDLPEKEKESDRNEADAMIEIFKGYLARKI